MIEENGTILSQARERITQIRKHDVQVRLMPPAGASLTGAHASVQLARHAFRFGCNGFGITTIEDAALRAGYEERFRALLNYATLPFYWGRFEPTRGATIESVLRHMAEWCKEQGLAVKGHPLVWHEVFPEWARADADEEVIRLQRRRVTEIVGAFRGLVDTWDVVNEATVAHRFDNAVGRYIAQAPAARVLEMLALAHEANPDAELLYNDFNIRPPDCEQLIQELVDADAPIAAIGLQSHMHRRYWALEEVWQLCERYARFGLPLHFTELTVVSGRYKDADDHDMHTVRTDWPTTTEGEERQLAYGEAVYTLLYSHPAVEAITTWNFSDYQAWMGAPAGLVRSDMSPKPLYDRLMQLIWGEWATHAEATLGGDTRLPVSCTAGDHAVTVRLPSGRELRGSFSVPMKGVESIAVSLS